MNIPKHFLANFSKSWRSVQNRWISGEIVVRQNGAVRLLGINRPERNNCLNLHLIQKLSEEIKSFESDSQSLTAVIYGEMGNFSSGLHEEDLKSDPSLVRNIENSIHNIQSRKPIVAAVSGFAVGHALDIALSCDFIVMEDTAVLSTYNRKTSAAPTKEQIDRLIGSFGKRKTLDWVLTGRQITAKEALSCGIASRVVACGTGLGQAVALANSLSYFPQNSLIDDKSYIMSVE